jgi:hypothetical protein
MIEIPISRAIRQYLASLNLPENAAFFSPLHGIGDRIRFYSYLKSFAQNNALNSYILIGEKKHEGLLDFYPDLSKEQLIRIPDGLLPDPIEQTHVYIGDDNPGKGKIYFTWHMHYRQGSGVAWEFGGTPDFTHDLAVKQILGVPFFTKPEPLFYTRKKYPPQKKNVYLAPFNRSNKGLPECFWLDLTMRLRSLGFEVFLNANKPQVHLLGEEQQYPALVKTCKTIDSSLKEFVELVASGSCLISVRSGLCDLFSLTSIPLISIFPEDCNQFWLLPQAGGNVYQAQFHPEHQEVLSKIICKTVENIATQPLSQA